MADRFIVVGAANVPYGGTPARRVGDKGGLWVIFDTHFGGPPSSSHPSTTSRAVADQCVRALNHYEKVKEAYGHRYCGGDRCGHFWNLPCDDPTHRRGLNPPVLLPCADPCRHCGKPTIGFVDRGGEMGWACCRCATVAQTWARSQEKGT
jgi:hypothetical protein